MVEQPATEVPSMLDLEAPGSEAAAPGAQPPTTQSAGTTTPLSEPPQGATMPASDEQLTGQAEPYQPRLLLVEATSPALTTFAEHLAGFASSILERQPSDLGISEAAGILEAAVRLSPRDDRLARQLVSARLLLGDIPASLEALEHYRRLRPDDVLAQIRYVDLSAAQMEITDERLAYLVLVAQSDRVPAEVRSHAAASASLVLREMMDDLEADAWLEQAVALDPYNPQALQRFYERRVQTQATRAQRVDALALLARSNILQPAVLQTLAEELAEAGLTEQAGDIYLRTLQASAALGLAPSLELVRDATALQLIADRPDVAAPNITGGIDVAARSDPEAYSVTALADLHMLDLVCRKRLTPGEDQLRQATEVTLNRLRFLLSGLSAQLRGSPRPTTNPDGSTPPAALVDVLADAAMLADTKLDEEGKLLRVPYATLMANLAWVELYFRAQPAEAPLIDALIELVPDESLALQRLRGWQLWREGKKDAAREILLPISEDDALARLALLLMEQEVGTAIQASASELLSSEPCGLVGAFLSDALREYGARVQAAEDAPEVNEAFATLSPALFGLLEPQNLRDFYSLTAEPRLARHLYGEPLLMTVSMRNSGRHTLTVGPEGVIQPVFRVDALVKGDVQEGRPFPAAAAAELWGAVRLDPGEKIEQIVRLDGPELSAFLASMPRPTLTISAQVTTNPSLIQGPQGPQHVTGPAGQSRMAQRMITRSGFPLDLSDPEVGNVVDARLDVLRTGEALDRMRAAQWAMGMISSLNVAAQQTEMEEADARQLRELAGRMADSLVRAASNLNASGPDAAADAFVKYAAAVIAIDSRERFLRDLLKSSAFEARILGLVAIPVLQPDQASAYEIVESLAKSDEDLTVRRLAQDVTVWHAEVAARAVNEPQSQPATAPSSGQGQ